MSNPRLTLHGRAELCEILHLQDRSRPTFMLQNFHFFTLQLKCFNLCNVSFLIRKFKIPQLPFWIAKHLGGPAEPSHLSI